MLPGDALSLSCTRNTCFQAIFSFFCKARLAGPASLSLRSRVRVIAQELGAPVATPADIISTDASLGSQWSGAGIRSAVTVMRQGREAPRSCTTRLPVKSRVCRAALMVHEEADSAAITGRPEVTALLVLKAISFLSLS